MNIVISVPEGTNVSEMSAEIQQAVSGMGANWAHSVMPGTRSFNGRSLVMAMVDVSLEVIEAGLTQLGLDWQVVAAQDFYDTQWSFSDLRDVNDIRSINILSMPKVYRTVHKLDVMNYAEDKIESAFDPITNAETITVRRPTPDEVPTPNHWSGAAPWANKDNWIIQAICLLPPEGFSQATGKPNVADIEALIEGNITAAERDTAWSYIQSIIQ